MPRARPAAASACLADMTTRLPSTGAPDPAAPATTCRSDEVVVILERDRANPEQRFEFRLLATSKTSTMQKELDAASGDGFELLGVTVGQTGFGGQEVVSILRRGLE